MHIEGNFFKWLYGHNVTGSTDLIKLVTDTVNALLVGNSKGLKPTAEELESLKQGNFKIHRIDLNKAILFADKHQAQMYLAMIKEHGTYPRRKKETHGNGVYFGKESTRTTLLYYHKGNEVLSHKKQQSITAELQDYADCMVRCEVRLYSQHLRDNNLNYGHVWDQDLVVKTVEEQHALLNLPPPITEADLPPAYLKFLAAYKQGVVPKAYTATTTARYKRDLAKQYGILL